jgi:hypothetical protein
MAAVQLLLFALLLMAVALANRKSLQLLLLTLR